MPKKKILIGVLAIMLVFAATGTGAFAKDHKHEQFDVLMGINFGFGISPNFFGLIADLGEGYIREGNYAFIMDLGLTADFYIFYWLSVNTGFLIHPDIYALLPGGTFGDDFSDIKAFLPICLTIPIAAHINIPMVEWLYLGAGMTLNIPLFGILDTLYDSRGDFFIGLPIDFGFDFVRSGRGGMRFFFRITPEFHERGTTWPIGFIWQIWNFKLYSK